MNITGTEQNIHQKKKIEKDLKKTIQQLLLVFCIVKKWKCVLLIFQKLTQIVENE